jgi:hypothetical protein
MKVDRLFSLGKYHHFTVYHLDYIYYLPVRMLGCMIKARSYPDNEIEVAAETVKQIREEAIERTCELSMPDDLSNGYADTPEQLSCVEPGALSAACEKYIERFTLLSMRQRDGIVDDLLPAINNTL